MEIVNLTPLDEIKVSSLGPGIELLMNDKRSDKNINKAEFLSRPKSPINSKGKYKLK